MRSYPFQAPTGKRLRRLKPRRRKKLHVDAFIDMIESRKLYFGGSIGEERIDGVVSTGRGSPTEEDRQAVLQWLRGRPEITDASVGEFADA